jgi:acyl-CoA synthetase (NDP forming)
MGISMSIDFDTISEIFRHAQQPTLLEHDVYAVLQAMGINTPRYLFVPSGHTLSEEDIAGFPDSGLVVKVVSPLIQHKSDVGGIRFVSAAEEAVNEALGAMRREIPGRYLKWITERSSPGQAPTLEAIQSSLLGFLVLEKVESVQEGFGSELLVGLRNSREFGPVVSLGLGGLDVEYLNARLLPGRSVGIASAHMLEPERIPDLLRPLAFYEKWTSFYRGRAPLISERTLADLLIRFQSLGEHYSPLASGGSGFVIEEAEVNPFVLSQGRLVPLDGLCRISRDKRAEQSRPFENIRFLLEPESIGIIGVSEKQNIGRIILQNILKQGFPADRVFVVKPGLTEIEGCRCVPGVADLPETVDLFVLTVSAEQSYGVMQDLVRSGNARSVIIIAGGLGEKPGTQDIETRIKGLLQEDRRRQPSGLVVNGGNCLGILSRPGRYDTTFIPEHKIFSLPRRNTRPYPVALFSQSGAYMISRMSQMPGIEPAFAVSIGNQIDLTISDYLNYLQDSEDVKIFALYIEGFLPDDGLALARAARRITRQAGKAVVAYKAGRSPEGRAATASHTASVAGDYAVCKALLEQEGVIVTETIDSFENTVKGLCFLADKKIRGRRVGLISNAGFECVIMSDSIRGDDCSLELASFSAPTVERIAAVMEPLGITELQDVRNPMDVTPVADDAAFCECVRAILEDPNVDCAVVSPLPMSPAMNTLAPSEFHEEDLTRGGSTPRRLVELFHETDKPWVVSIDTGAPYRPLKDMLELEGVPVLRRCDEAVAFLRCFIDHLGTGYFFPKK